jgi:zinc protease
MLGGPSTTRADADYPAILVANMALGAPQSGRLMRVLREAHGWSYNAQSGLVTYKHGGLWLAFGDVSTPRTGEALTVFLDELKRLATEPVSPSELDDAKRSLVGTFALSLENQSSVAGSMANRRTEGLSADYWQRFADLMHAVTPDDIRRAAAKYMDPSKAQVIAVGDREQIVPLLSSFGPITFYDVDGRPIK